MIAATVERKSKTFSSPLSQRISDPAHQVDMPSETNRCDKGTKMPNRLRNQTAITFATLAFLISILLPPTTSTTSNIVRAGGNQPDNNGNTPTSILQEFQTGQAADLIATHGLPIKPLTADSTFAALRVNTWMENNVHRFALDGWSQIQIGTHHFKAKRATGWIHKRRTTIETAGAEPQLAIVNEIAVFLEGLSAADQPAGMAASGDDLLLTATTIGAIALESDAYREGQPADRTAFLQRGEARLVTWIRNRIAINDPSIASPNAIIMDRPVKQKSEPIDHPTLQKYFGLDNESDTTDQQARNNLQDTDTQPKSGPTGYWTGGADVNPFGALVRPPATVFFRADELTYNFSQDGEEGFATLRGNLVVQYTETARRPGAPKPRQLTLQADRAVIITDPIASEDIQIQRINADSVRGIYLEGNVNATDGDFTMRGPRMYYEFDSNRAIVLEAVLSTYNKQARVPIYVRADELRQVAESEWTADDVTISTSEFYTPSISLGAKHLRIAQTIDQNTGESRNDITVKNATLRAGTMPFFWWPHYRVAAEEIPLRKLSFGGNENDGFTTRSEWNLFALLGIEPPGDIDTSFLLDYYDERGVALGFDTEYRTRNGEGRWSGYFLPDDDGTDKLSSGQEIEQDGDSRGMILGWHREDLGDNWTLILEGAYVSDETFMDQFFDGLTENQREFQTRAYLRHQQDNAQFEFFGNYAVNDFLINEDLLQAQTYQVEKLPELGYYRYGDDLFNGRVSLSSEYRISRMRLRFPDHTLADIGQGQAGFGYPPNTNLRDAFIAGGMRETFTDRFFTRHELTMPLKWGSVNVTPFITGRVAFYDDDEVFRTYSSNAEDSWWLVTGGVRFNTQFSRVDNGVDNRLFDLHRLRHIIEPSVTVWHGESNANGTDYPIYDLDVEGVTRGSAVAFGLRNTWQTMRGGPGRWHSVDVLTVDTNVIMAGNETQDEYDIPRYYSYRPEYSRLGDHVQTDFKWLASDSLAIAGDSVYDTNNGHMARGNLGYRIDHSASLFSYADYRFYDFNNDDLLGMGLGYTLTPTYQIRFGTSYDLNADESRNVAFGLTRKMPQFDLGISANYDNQRDETTIGVVFSPKGSGGRTYGGLLNPRSDQR